jgi:hypothetical protein
LVAGAGFAAGLDGFAVVVDGLSFGGTGLAGGAAGCDGAAWLSTLRRVTIPESTVLP